MDIRELDRKEKKSFHTAEFTILSRSYGVTTVGSDDSCRLRTFPSEIPKQRKRMNTIFKSESRIKFVRKSTVDSCNVFVLFLPSHNSNVCRRLEFDVQR